MRKKSINIVFIIAIVIIAVFAIMPKTNVSITKKINNDSTFKYSTSITGNLNRADRADVYTTDMSVPDTAKYLIDKKRPESYTDLSNEEAIQLVYDDHYVLIYKGEDGKTYVQVCSRKYVHRNGYYGLYRPFNRNIIMFYDNSYLSSRYYRVDSNRYNGGYYKKTSNKVNNASTTKDNSTKIKTEPNNSTKIKTDKNSSSKIKTKTSTSHSTSHSVRQGSTSSRRSMGGGTSFGK